MEDQEAYAPEEDAAAKLSAAWRTIAATPEGQLVLQDLVARFAFTQRSTYSPEPNRTFINEGCRTVMVYIGRYV